MAIDISSTPKRSQLQLSKPPLSTQLNLARERPAQTTSRDMIMCLIVSQSLHTSSGSLLQELIIHAEYDEAVAVQVLYHILLGLPSAFAPCTSAQWRVGLSRPPVIKKLAGMTCCCDTSLQPSQKLASGLPHTSHTDIGVSKHPEHNTASLHQ